VTALPQAVAVLSCLFGLPRRLQMCDDFVLVQSQIQQQKLVGPKDVND